jgi:hypothetical protein
MVAAVIGSNEAVSGQRQDGIVHFLSARLSWPDSRSPPDDLFSELLPKPLEGSAILVADEELNPPASLVENAGHYCFPDFLLTRPS